MERWRIAALCLGVVTMAIVDVSYINRYKIDYNNSPYKYVSCICKLKKYKRKILMELKDIIKYNYINRSVFALFTPYDINANVDEVINKFRLCSKMVFPKSPYLFVVERFEKGGFHIHAIIFNCDKLDKKLLEYYNGAFVKLKELDISGNLAEYLCKYITKNRATKRAYYYKNVVICPY